MSTSTNKSNIDKLDFDPDNITIMLATTLDSCHFRNKEFYLGEFCENKDMESPEIYLFRGKEEFVDFVQPFVDKSKLFTVIKENAGDDQKAFIPTVFFIKGGHEDELKQFSYRDIGKLSSIAHEESNDAEL